MKIQILPGMVFQKKMINDRDARTGRMEWSSPYTDDFSATDFIL